MDVKFWKALIAYTGTFSIGIPFTKRHIDQMDLKDLSV